MGKIFVVLSKQTENKLRRFIKERYESRRGALSTTIEDAVRKYLDENSGPAGI